MVTTQVAHAVLAIHLLSGFVLSVQNQTGKTETFIDNNGNKVTITYFPVGCYRDSEDRALRNSYYNYRSRLDWGEYPDFSAVISACAREAYLNGYRTMFGVQFWGECWSDGSARRRFDRLGPSGDCEHGVGKHWANFVYEFTAIRRSLHHDVPGTCRANDEDYKEGDAMFLPSEWLKVSDAKCMKCACSGGLARECRVHHHCDSSLASGMCEKYQTKPGECCPTCACVSKGEAMPVGAWWAVRQDSKCSECTCSSRGVAQCVAVLCHCPDGYEPDSETVPGKCCPKCHPRQPSPQPIEIIEITTPRPPPVFPSPPWPMQGKKRK